MTGRDFHRSPYVIFHLSTFSTIAYVENSMHSPLQGGFQSLLALFFHDWWICFTGSAWYVVSITAAVMGPVIPVEHEYNEVQNLWWKPSCLLTAARYGIYFRGCSKSYGRKYRWNARTSLTLVSVLRSTASVLVWPRRAAAPCCPLVAPRDASASACNRGLCWIPLHPAQISRFCSHRASVRTRRTLRS